MQDSLFTAYKSFQGSIVQYRKILGILVIILLTILVLLVAISYFVISSDKKYVLDTHDASDINSKHANVGLVLGAGITKDGKPFKELQARLDSAADALNKGYVNKLLLSGDNRFENYDEPTAMKNYLVQVKHISENKLQPDFAGRSTYESCERAAKIFGQRDKSVIIFSAGSHLPRAIYLCRKFDVNAYGIANNTEANNATRREILARTKAIMNIYIKGEPTILGNPIHI